MIKYILTMLTMASLRHRQQGLTTVEYAVAGGLIAAAVILAFIALGTGTGGVVQGIADELP